MKERIGSPGPASRPATLLIVEDDDSSREMYVMYMEAAGFGVVAARNGAEALVAARRYEPQVVITDVSMPGMTGLELARALRQRTETRQMGIIVLSGRPLDEPSDREAQRQFDLVLTKPCLPDELLRQVRRLIAPGPTGSRSGPPARGQSRRRARRAGDVLASARTHQRGRR